MIYRTKKIFITWLSKFDEPSYTQNEKKKGVFKLDDKTKEKFSNFIKEYDDDRLKILSEFHKAVLAISSTGIGWILVNREKLNGFSLEIKLSVGFFCISILATVLGMFFSAKGYRRYADQIQNSIGKGDFSDFVYLVWEIKFARILVTVALIFFCGGLLAVSFAILRG